MRHFSVNYATSVSLAHARFTLSFENLRELINLVHSLAMATSTCDSCHLNYFATIARFYNNSNLANLPKCFTNSLWRPGSFTLPYPTPFELLYIPEPEVVSKSEDSSDSESDSEDVQPPVDKN
ncbi:hypothetical protein ElyMa_002807500 [Elysia marginata]|uniref:Uncharacterized protein n=1 Tax=Elysia marginata TaxID=1093978 RepID=A0AAV4HQC8_9GAST|nr:hypothetical protein ElyMa_002807500 [Elysia marginata]